jgi:hypothetical protein
MLIIPHFITDDLKPTIMCVHESNFVGTLILQNWQLYPENKSVWNRLTIVSTATYSTLEGNKI